MKLKNILTIALLATSLTSCFEDETTMGTGAISEIVIDSTSIQQVYNINKNETLTITPVISQTNKEKDVTYTWEINLETYSHDKEFVYEGKELGSYLCRLIVENSDGKSFFPFELHVNSPYEEGITLISKDAEGNSMLSFMLTPADGSEPTGFMTGDQFSANNTDITFAANPADMVQSSGSLIIACQGNEDGTSPATIYYLNEKTFVVENMVTAPEFPDFKPTLLGIPSQGYQGISYPVLCEGGNVYEFSPTEGALIKPVKMPYTYAQTAINYDEGSASSYNLIFWDKDINALCLIYNGYQYYCGKDYHMKRDTIEANKNINVFNGLSICKMVLIEQQKGSIGRPKVLIITRNLLGRYLRTVISVDFWEWNSQESKNELIYESRNENGNIYDVCGSGELSLTETTPCIANNRYNTMLFAEKNKIRQWKFNELLSDNKLPNINEANILLTVGSESAIITSMELSADHTRTYVAFYEPDQSGLNGSVWVIDTDKGTVLKQYNNVCYQPVKIMYKKK